MVTIWNNFLSAYLQSRIKTSPVHPQPFKTTLPDGTGVTLRPEAEADWTEVELLTRRAFRKEESVPQLGGIGCDEHYLVRLLRGRPEFLPELDFVAVSAERIVGNIMYSVSCLLSPDGKTHPVLTFGPLSVLPEYQRRGVGGALLRHTVDIARGLGFGGILIFGHPEYYPRFGFTPASEFGISTSDGKNFPAFMGLELAPAGLNPPGSRLILSPVFEIDAQKALEYDRQLMTRQSHPIIYL